MDTTQLQKRRTHSHSRTVARFMEMMVNILLQEVFSIVHWQKKNLLRGEASLATLVLWIKGKAVFLKDQLVIKVFTPVNNITLTAEQNRYNCVFIALNSISKLVYTFTWSKTFSIFNNKYIIIGSRLSSPQTSKLWINKLVTDLNQYLSDFWYTAPKNWCFWNVVLEKTLESPLDCKDIQPINHKGNLSWIFIGRTDAEAETPVPWPPDVKNWLTGKDPDAGKDWRQEEKGMTGWDGWMASLTQWTWVWVTLGVGVGHGSLACCSPCGRRVGHNWTPKHSTGHHLELLKKYLGVSLMKHFRLLCWKL